MAEILPLSAQTRAVDSLQALIKNDRPDTNKIIHLNDLAWEIMYVQPDTSIKLSKRALSLSKKLRWEKGVALSTGQLGTFEWIKGDYPQAQRHFLHSLGIYEKLGLENNTAAILTNLGTIYLDQKKTARALDYYMKALKIMLAHNDENGISSIYGNLGNAYAESGDFDKALDYFLKGFAISERQGDQQKMATDLGNIGNIYVIKGNYKKALEFNGKALKLVEAHGNLPAVARNLGVIGSIHATQKNYKAAESFFLRSLETYKKSGVPNELWQVELSLSELYTELKHHKPALDHYKAAMALKDSLFNNEKSKEIAQREMNYDFQKKEAAVKTQRDKKNAIAKAALTRKQQQLNYFLAGLILVALIALFILRGLKRKQQANAIMTRQKEEVEKKNVEIEKKQSEIIDSINYASRIQRSLLPSNAYIQSKLNSKKPQ
ncbi:MAG TPA: tetratricopeptide repeat protein [Flavobacteriales bacterium]|nr:tetratricopeptide repeat protein [Flavobacteriales bacterium]